MQNNGNWFCRICGTFRFIFCPYYFYIFYAVLRRANAGSDPLCAALPAGAVPRSGPGHQVPVAAPGATPGKSVLPNVFPGVGRATKCQWQHEEPLQVKVSCQIIKCASPRLIQFRAKYSWTCRNCIMCRRGMSLDRRPLLTGSEFLPHSNPDPTVFFLIF